MAIKKLRSRREVPIETEKNAAAIPREETSFGNRGQTLVDRMRGRGTSGMSTEEVMALTREES